MPKLLPEPPGQRKRPRWAYIRSLLPVLAILLIFSFLLASYSLLSHFRSPAAKQRLGWQSWDVIHVKTSQTVQETAQTNGSDWVPSIPIDVWVSFSPKRYAHTQDPLAIHTTGRKSFHSYIEFGLMGSDGDHGQSMFTSTLSATSFLLARDNSRTGQDQRQMGRR
jgi:hypothetical protein